MNRSDDTARVPREDDEEGMNLLRGESGTGDTYKTGTYYVLLMVSKRVMSCLYVLGLPGPELLDCVTALYSVLLTFTCRV